MSIMIFAAVGAVVLVPLAREYASFRRDWGLGRRSAFATTALVLPSLGVGFALALPLAERPGLQWLVTVVATLAVYSAAVRAVEQLVEPTAAPGRR